MGKEVHLPKALELILGGFWNLQAYTFAVGAGATLIVTESKPVRTLANYIAPGSNSDPYLGNAYERFQRGYNNMLAIHGLEGRKFISR